MTEDIKARLAGLTEEDLLDLLGAVSDEVKRRNELVDFGIPDVRGQTPQQNLSMVLEALADIAAGGVRE